MRTGPYTAVRLIIQSCQDFRLGSPIESKTAFGNATPRARVRLRCQGPWWLPAVHAASFMLRPRPCPRGPPWRRRKCQPWLTPSPARARIAQKRPLQVRGRPFALFSPPVWAREMPRLALFSRFSKPETTRGPRFQPLWRQISVFRLFPNSRPRRDGQAPRQSGALEPPGS